MRRAAVLFISLVVLMQVCVRAQSGLIMIVHPGVKLNAISRSDLRNIFVGESVTLKDGTHAIPVLQKEHTAHEEFLQEYIGKSDIAYRAGWRSLVFIGHASMPRSLEPESAIVDYVAHTPGTIAYIRRETPHAGVKVLLVQ